MFDLTGPVRFLQFDEISFGPEYQGGFICQFGPPKANPTDRMLPHLDVHAHREKDFSPAVETLTGRELAGPLSVEK